MGDILDTCDSCGRQIPITDIDTVWVRTSVLRESVQLRLCGECHLEFHKRFTHRHLLSRDR